MPYVLNILPVITKKENRFWPLRHYKAIAETVNLQLVLPQQRRMKHGSSKLPKGFFLFGFLSPQVVMQCVSSSAVFQRTTVKSLEANKLVRLHIVVCLNLACGQAWSGQLGGPGQFLVGRSYRWAARTVMLFFLMPVFNHEWITCSAPAITGLPPSTLAAFFPPSP